MYMEETVAQKAVEQTGFGKFNLKIMAVSALIYLNSAICITSIGFVVSSAACDFQMTTIDKGRINAAPMLGMVAGSGIWGCLADIKGRRISLLLSLFLQFSSDALSSLVPSYWTFVFLKFVSGIGVTGQLSITFTYLGEFQPTRYRHQVLSWMELSWAIGVIAVALLAWGTIPLEFAFKVSAFSFSSWNLFVLMSAMAALLVDLYLVTLPETPKFLAESGQRDELLKVLTRMFIENTGKSTEQFKEKLAKCGIPSISALVNEHYEIGDPDKSLEAKTPPVKKEKLQEMLTSTKAQIKALLRKPYAKRLFVTSSIIFCMTSTYYSLMTWFPELFQRFASFEKAFPDEFASICSVSKKVAAALNGTEESERLGDPFGCGSQMDTTVYTHSMWLGAACFPCAILLPLTVNRLGYRVFLLFTSSISCAVTIAFFFVKTSMQNLILSCLFEALTSLNISVILCVIVDIFPTNLRVMASAIVLFIGRFGALIGNVLFGYLIDDYCQELIIIMAVQLLVATSLCWATPNRDEMRKIQDPSTVEVKNTVFAS